MNKCCVIIISNNIYDEISGSGRSNEEGNYSELKDRVLVFRKSVPRKRRTTKDDDDYLQKKKLIGDTLWVHASQTTHEMCVVIVHLY